jgi:hypothetical protein
MDDPREGKHGDRHHRNSGCRFCCIPDNTNQAILRNSIHERITNESFQILKFLSDAQGTYEYFYSSKEPPKELDEKLKYATEMVSNYLEHVLLQKKYLPRAVRGNWHSYVKEICKTAPIVREHVERYKTQYSKTLRRVIDKVEKEIKNRPIEG